MKTVTLVFGAFHIIGFFAGAIGLIDYHVCIKWLGECRIEAAHDIKGKP